MGIKIGAGIVATLIVLPILGPVLAGGAGIAAAYGTTKDGLSGDACRAAGEVAMKAKEKAREVNEKHNIVDRSKKNVNGVLSNMKHSDRFDVLGKIGEIMKELSARISMTIQQVSEQLKKQQQKRNSRATSQNSKGRADSFDSYEKVPSVVPLED